MAHAAPPGRGGIVALAFRIITGWAILGGIVLLVVALMNVASVIGGIFGQPFPGDFEITEMGVAIAAFSFLPYCQLTGANVTADIFTARASARAIALFALLASLVAFLFSALLLWRMYAGLLNQQEYNYTTTILQIPIWWAFVPVLISLALLVVASAITLRQAGAELAGRQP